MATGFHEVQFPPDIAYGASGGPEYATDVVMVDSGYEQRNVRWAEARGKWDVASGVKNRAQMDVLIAFFRARKGRAYGFRYKDWSDYQALSQPIGIGDGTRTGFQLAKVYQSGGATESRTITKPVAGTVTVMVAGIAQTSRWAVDTTTGIVTFSANVGKTVAGVTNASPCAVTTTANHGLGTGDSIHLSGIQGTTQLNGRRFVITRISATAFSLNGVDATHYGAWTGGGTVNTLPQAGESVTASFEFDVPARFDTDRMQVTIDTWDVQTWGPIPIVELRV